MKRIEEEAHVEVKKGWPLVIRWRGRTYRVQRLVDYWVVRGRWWTAEEKRVYFRVETQRSTMDVYRAGERWVVSKVWD